jgi:hypothetical protein
VRQSSQSGAANKNSSWRAGVCLLLAILFFYNPFFTVYGSPAGLSAQHPLSFRGTVASSELRSGILKQAAPKIDAPAESALEIVPLPGALLLDSESSPEEPLILEREAVSKALWIRPPPIF